MSFVAPGHTLVVVPGVVPLCTPRRPTNNGTSKKLIPSDLRQKRHSLALKLTTSTAPGKHSDGEASLPLVAIIGRVGLN